ncbi:NAD(P)/FAD-dependent oxidoreductase [Herbaspirillum seropedicae]|uniref:NADH:ubiquinone reductase (non-electrogenic) n=1 Tax=Herbaspirillum seropedicae (strain SmR1) TaxID=757424 RepID=D8IRE5_HERSS|nr:NAD(P)/FAD-dependent oxidoreductase [Herbaspirillum seropedicae]ADJ63269.1 NADH dehydrogenase, FAD-containing subunit, protein; cytochrome c reductase protein [Herbaspirillum seropedicae SmR1]AKN65312.1 pyridine nucleotide-disulfide oxidoreductase [Herbaspirillum seropedicae]MDR6394930.1 NADH dehydrogenase [Herbaspirillum seropedicae]NQE31549.1 pyridine nucleotide-disulfide oxidoreductase [Herbaspirillum seropedicae]QDD64189.1 NAD(P)/FAD-dependent oxidoreductase [Herbaspirillum seropedicae]
MPHVVIIGCGFGGLAAARELANAEVRITMIDRSNHHLFQPLLYQVATAGLSAPAISAPIRAILAHQRNLTTLMAAVTGIDTAAKTVQLEDGSTMAYDHLIVAAGSTHSYFGRDEWSSLAPGLKTLEDAFEIRKRILMAFERAERESDARRRQEWLTFTVIGGGATGVEMAGTLVEIARHTLAGEFRNIDPHSARVVLIEGSDRILGAYPPDLSDKAREQLQKLGVDVRTGSRVVHIDETCVRYTNFDGEQTLSTRTVIWSAGVAASPLGRALGVELDRAGRVPVSPELNIAGHDDVYVIGDLAAAQSEGKPVPGVSPAAKQMGRVAARNIKHRIAGQTPETFVYQDYGSLATIGRKAAIAMVGKLKFSGYPAWLFWLFVHVYFLIGFRNRIMVMADWAWAYFTFKRSARVISATMPTQAEQSPLRKEAAE